MKRFQPLALRKEKQQDSTGFKRPRAKKTPIMTWLRERTFPDVYGYEEMVGDKREARPSYMKQKYQYRRNSRRWLRKLPNYEYARHFDGQAIFYYFGNPEARSSLVMIDIDVEKKMGKGTTQGAVAFATHLKKFWPDLYFEPSSSFKGIHCYLVLDKPNHDASEVNAFLMKLQDWLRAEVEFTKADIELVEVKGTCPVITREPTRILGLGYTFTQNLITSVKYGQFAKIPRQAHRFEELKKTTVLCIEESLPENSGPVMRLPKPQKQQGGSISGQNISDEELAMIPEFERYYEAVGVQLRDQRYVVSSNDFAIFCVLQRFFYNSMNTDGTLPVRRIAKFWDSLHACGQAERPFNHHRFKVIRDFLSEKGHIEWQDHRYQWSGEGKKGIACKWRLTGHFFSVLQRVGEEGGASFVVIHDFYQGTAEHRTPIPYPIEAEKERKWWSWAYHKLENFSLAA